jgi:hypothetical protein
VKKIERRGTYRMLMGNPDEKYFEDLGIDGRIILKLIFKNCNGEAWARLICLLAGSCECGINHQAFLKFGEFLDSLTTF